MLGLLGENGGWDALVVRSQTRVDAELLSAAAPRLSVVGVASVGIDRIDVEAATRAGVMVVNAPTGNTIAAAEHTMALMLALLRHVPTADASVRAGEWERGRYTGRELRGKTLGLVGLGKIGKAVARRAAGFEMRVITSDPYLTEDQAAEFGAKLVGLAELLHRSDVISVHTPLTAQTRGMLGRAQLEATKPGAFVLNVARGGIVDEAALADALTSGHLAGAAVDVYSTEPITADNPLRAAPNLVLTPHLGASTAEAQDRVALEMAEQVLLALSGVTPPYAVNAPAVGPETAPRLRPYVELGRRLAILARQLAPSAFDALSLTYAGEIAAGECAPIRTAAVAGHPRGRHRPARQRRQRRPRRARARADRPRDAHGVVGAVGLAGGGGRRPVRRSRRADPGRLDRPRPAAPGRARWLRDRRRAGRAHARDPPPRPAGDRRRGRHHPRRGGHQHLLARAVAPLGTRRGDDVRVGRRPAG